MVIALTGSTLAAPVLNVEVISPKGQSHRYSDQDRKWLQSIENFASGKENGKMTVKFSGARAPQPWVISKKGDALHNNIGGGVRPDGSSKALIEDLHKMFTLHVEKMEIQQATPHP